MTCPNCDYEIDPMSGLTCPRCGNTIDCSAVHCGECGGCTGVLGSLRRRLRTEDGEET